MSGVVPPGRAVAIHPGFVKTATSTLQRHVFPNHADIAYLGLPGPTPELEWAVRHLCQADSVHYERARIEAAFAAALAAAPAGRVAVISYENFALYESKDKGLVAQRLKELFPEARLLFTIRRQEDLVVSWYFTKLRVRIKRKAFIPFEEWYWSEGRESHQSIHDDLRYGRTIGLYAELFGRENVHVVPFELLKQSAAGFAAGCAQAIGVDAGRFEELLAGKRENASMSQRYFDFWRRFGHFLPRKLVRKWSRSMAMHEGSTARVALPAAVRADIGKLVAEDNRSLAAMFGLDLEKLGYTLKAP